MKFLNINPLPTARTLKYVGTWFGRKIAKNTILVQIWWFLLWILGRILPLLLQKRSEAWCEIWIFFNNIFKKSILFDLKVKLTFFAIFFFTFLRNYSRFFKNFFRSEFVKKAALKCRANQLNRTKTKQMALCTKSLIFFTFNH